jgi:hypothetical protein
MDVSSDFTIPAFGCHITIFPLNIYRLIMERRFAHTSDPESYAGGGVSSL